MTDPLERLFALVRRELGAESARVLEADEEDTTAENVLTAELPDGRRLAAVFASPPAPRDALSRRLTMLTATFAHALEHGPRSGARPPIAVSLLEELRALVQRSHAVDAAVIDAHSPVVWGAASEERGPSDPSLQADISEARLTLLDSASPSFDVAANADDVDPGTAPRPAHPARARELTERAVDLVRGMPGISALRKGGHVGQTVRETDFGVFVRSFASIYLLVVVFDDAFDELRAERAVEDGLPRIERLVLALPPLDPKPSPIAGVISSGAPAKGERVSARPRAATARGR